MITLVAGPTSAATQTLDLAALAAGAPGTRVHNRALRATSDGGRAAVRFDARQDNGLAWFTGVNFSTGVIECDIKGRNLPGRSFVGIAFHGVDARTYEAVYFRPFNFGNPDPAHRAHSVQYISMPGHDWWVLRRDHPGIYENAIVPAPTPEVWFHARIVVETKRVNVFVNGAAHPCLTVTRLTDRGHGWVGLWVGNGSDGVFANLTITDGDTGQAK